MNTISPATGASIAILALCAPAHAADEAPDIAQALLDAAYATENPDEIAAVAKAVKAVFPNYAETIGAQADAQIAKFTPAPADDATPTPDPLAPKPGVFAIKPWDGKVQLGASFASGNSDNSAVGVTIDAARTAGKLVHNVTAYADIAEANGTTNQKRWGASYQLDYKISERMYTYGRFSYDEDEFSGFDYRLFAGAGLGYFVAKSEPFTWKLEGGPGFRYSPIDLTREVEEEIAIYAASEVDWRIREGVTFEQDFFTTWTSPTTTFQSITSLTTNLTESISTALSFEYRYETDPPLDRENTDTVARASVVYGF